MKSAEESMEILESFDLTGSLRATADLAGCSHHTVARVVAERDAGGARPRTCRPRLIDEFLPKVEEWVEASKGKIRADVAHEKLMAMGFPGVGAVVPAGGRRDQEAVPAGERAGPPAVGDRARVVVAVRLR